MHHNSGNETSIDLLLNCSDLLIIRRPGTG